ncbi:hypothetical protein [Georhizobium sp. MAB10]|uniref:hypothetical protein n=1 Tax=Georhizobium sp. MAB10 TaxID=3028319 RepID=UPI0038560330
MSVDGDPVSETPTIKEGTWEAIALASAVMLIVWMFIAAGWIILAGEIELAQKRTAVAAAFVTAGAAVVTFCTVIWRGKINERQTNTARDQLRATEEANWAKLLQDGAALVFDSQTGKQSAGLASLEAVVQTQHRLFAKQAMNLIADYLEQVHPTDHRSPLAIAAIDALGSGHSLGFQAARSLKFEGPNKDNKRFAPRSIWVPILGVRLVRYYGGRMDTQYPHFNEACRHSTFEKVYFSKASIKDMSDFESCFFRNCKIEEIGYMIQENTFQSCDFSGAVNFGIESIDDMPDLRPRNNFYWSDRPPIGVTEIDWASRIISVPSQFSNVFAGERLMTKEGRDFIADEVLNLQRHSN